MKTIQYDTRAVAVLSDGPFPTQDPYGDEMPVWQVSRLNYAGDQLGPCTTCYSLDAALALAKSIAKVERLEWVNEAMRA